MTILAPIAIAAAGTAVGAYFQNRSWNNQQIALQKATALSTANALFQVVSDDLGSQYTAASRLFNYYKQKETGGVDPEVVVGNIDTLWSGYMTIMVAAAVHEDKDKALIYLNFGQDSSDYFAVIKDHFSQVHDLLMLLRFPKGDQKSQALFAKQAFAKQALYEHAFKTNVGNFVQLMADHIQRGEVGIFHRDAATLRTPRPEQVTG